MKGALWSTVVASVIVLQMAAYIPLQSNLYILKLAGRWRARAVVVDHGEVTSTPSYPTKVEVKKNGDMIDTKKFSITTNCKDSSMYLKATDQLGKFEIASQNSILRVVDTDYDGHYIFHIESPRGNELHLYVRKQRIPNSVIRKFRNTATFLGFDKDKIIYRTHTGSCPN